MRIAACAVCRTDLHVVDGELPNPKLPLVPGHEIVGRIERYRRRCSALPAGRTRGNSLAGLDLRPMRFCLSNRENLCSRARFTGYTIDGGYADYTVANASFCFPLPDAFNDTAAAPLLCAGLIGYRSLRKTGDAQRLGIYGFGAAAHIVAQVARFQGRQVFAFTRPGDVLAQEFARRLGAVWVGGSDESPPDKLDAAIIFAPAGPLVPYALRAVEKGGIVVCGGIHMSDIPSFPYRELMGGADTLLGCESYPARRRGVLCHRSARPRAYRNRAIPAGAGECGSRAICARDALTGAAVLVTQSGAKGDIA